MWEMVDMATAKRTGTKTKKSKAGKKTLVSRARNKAKRSPTR
jgi:hypothetical protein